MYKIKDNQIDRYFADGETFKTKKEICEQLISYHENDCNMKVEKKLLKENRINDCLIALCDLGDWEIVLAEKIDVNWEQDDNQDHFKEIELPLSVYEDWLENKDDSVISDYLSDEYGWLVKSFCHSLIN